jgi:hypothetical protein
MVESNHDEERLARIEHMVERLPREQAATGILTAKLVAVVSLVADTHALQAAESKRQRRRPAPPPRHGSIRSS